MLAGVNGWKAFLSFYVAGSCCLCLIHACQKKNTTLQEKSEFSVLKIAVKLSFYLAANTQCMTEVALT